MSSSLLLHHVISTLFTSATPLHLYSLHFCYTTSSLLSSLLLHHFISTLFTSATPRHLYSLHFCYTTSSLLSSLLLHHVISTLLLPLFTHPWILSSSRVPRMGRRTLGGRFLSTHWTSDLELSSFLCQAFPFPLFVEVKTGNPSLLFCILMLFSSHRTNPVMHMCVCVRARCTRLE